MWAEHWNHSLEKRGIFSREACACAFVKALSGKMHKGFLSI